MQVSVETVKIPICFHSVLVLNRADPSRCYQMTSYCLVN